MKKIIASIIIIICLLTAFSSTVVVEWLYNNFDNLPMDEIIFHLKVPIRGANTDIVEEAFNECIWKIINPTLIIAAILVIPMIKNLKIAKWDTKSADKKSTVWINMGISILILMGSLTRILVTTDVGDYVANQIDTSKLIEQEYVRPENTKIEFAEQKRNLIYIFLESMETTYYSKEDGGLAENDLIPEISKLAKENIDFSDTEKIGGAHVLPGTSWTVAAMSAQTTGVPLKMSIDGNKLGDYNVFLEGAYGIGQVLEENGYNNFLLLGSKATFGGRNELFTQHGNYEIYDFFSALNEGRISEKIWWGYTDDKLFEYAKEKILNLSEKEEPFNFTMLTADTHFVDGYKCDDCPNKWDEQYKNVISCSSKRVGEFIEWIKEQDFYEDTTIVIAGDHLTMKSGFFALEEGEEYDKKVVSLIMNSAVEEKIANREYSTMDLYPTTLAALGANIEGNKLALGTNLFSEEKTLIERFGLEYIKEELTKTSRFYDNNILVSK